MAIFSSVAKSSAAASFSRAISSTTVASAYSSATATKSHFLPFLRCGLASNPFLSPLIPAPPAYTQPLLTARPSPARFDLCSTSWQARNENDKSRVRSQGKARVENIKKLTHLFVGGPLSTSFSANAFTLAVFAAANSSAAASSPRASSLAVAAAAASTFFVFSSASFFSVSCKYKRQKIKY